MIQSKEIQIISIKEIKVNPNNRNKHTKEQIDRLVEIIEYQGFRNPLIVSNRTGLLVAGHGRLQAAKKMKLKEVPVMCQDFLDEAQEYAAMVSDNAIASWSELDLSSINTDITDLGPDFNIDLLGIKNFSIDVADKEGLCDEDEVPEYVEPKTKLGDIYQLGNHRLMCGDSTDQTAIVNLLSDEEVELIFSDPPYGIDYQDVKKSHKKIANDSTQDNISALLVQLFSFRCPIFICCNWKCFSTFETAMRDSGHPIKSCIVWDKTSRVQNLDKFGKQHEFILYSGPFGGEKTVDVDVWQCKRQVLAEHPTSKPVEIVERAIGHFKVLNVLDLFGGSGSTLIACEKTNRKCFMMELDPHYCDVIVARWEKFTGNKAELTNG